MARDSCLARVTAGVAVGGAVGGAVGARASEDQVYWTNNTWKCCHIWPFLGGREFDTLWKVILNHKFLNLDEIILFAFSFLAFQHEVIADGHLFS
ncbi:uncharacterized protein LOC111484176 isoform X1 [Cucurbita maxima]|uniref:Uncharacterized protein LOC111484176 isoform X1 n=1 Tax=Cucurbita maxima TaxID=3661 RepID=A0A6J1JB31_CUCMA|nr:uncharacterized protein LOC111484176 isoform X1 [Cucurbita maxima]